MGEEDWSGMLMDLQKSFVKLFCSYETLQLLRFRDANSLSCNSVGKFALPQPVI